MFERKPHLVFRPILSCARDVVAKEQSFSTGKAQVRVFLRHAINLCLCEPRHKQKARSLLHDGRIERMEGAMPDTNGNRTGWQTINRRVVDLQRKIRALDELTAIDERNHNLDRDADLPFGRAEVRLEVQRWWWQL